VTDSMAEMVRFADATLAGAETWVAIDQENGQAFGPFSSHDNAVTWVAAVQVRTGEWEQGMQDGDLNEITQDLMNCSWFFYPLQQTMELDQFGPAEGAAH
jgi:hypothetical protein